MAFSGVQAKFLKFTSEEKASLLALLEPLRPNQNTLAEILGLLADLSNRDRQSSLQILQEAMASMDPHKPAPWKLEKLREFLAQRRYPRYWEKKKKFDSLVKAMKLPAGIKLEPPPFFEEPSLQITARLSSEEDRQHLIKVLENGHFKELLKLVD